MAKQPIFALIDCNNFFVSCERVFRPDLWNKPVAVLSNNDGCIVARSNEVKKLGVPMGVPLFQVSGLLKQHEVTLFSGNFPLYGDFSQRVVQVLQQTCPSIEVYSVDESFLEISELDITSYAAWALELRQKILKWTGIPVSVGVAPTKTLAKAAAEYAKSEPFARGAYAIVADQQRTAVEAQALRDHLLRWLPVGDVWGIGRRTAPKLQQLGIATASDLIRVTDRWAQAQLSIRGLKTVKELRGEACLGIASDEPQQSIACTRSFGHRVRNYYELEGAVATFAARAAAKLRQQNEVAYSVLTFLRSAKGTGGYYGHSVATRLAQPSADTGALIRAALDGLRQLYDPDLGYKKAGVVLVNLAPTTAWQLSLLQGNVQQLERQSQLMHAVDIINKRFGTRLVRHASEQLGNRTWHSKREQCSPAYTSSWQQLPTVQAA